MKTQVSFSLAALFLLIFVFHSTGQPSWMRVTPTPQENSLNAVIKIPGTNKLIATGWGSTVMISENYGDTWEFIFNPAEMNNDFYGQCIYFINTEIGFIGGSGRTIVKTTDGGTYWQAVYESGVYNWSCFYDIAFCNETTGFAVGDYTSLKKTTDGGDSWFGVELGNDFNLSSIEFFNENIGYIFGASNEYVIKTIDGGENWEIIEYPTGLENLEIEDVQFADETTGYIFGNTGYPNSDGVICKTTDAGNTWESIHTDYSAYTGKVDFLDAEHGIIGCGTWNYQSKILHTENGGEDWSETLLPGFSWFGTNSVCFIDPEHLISVGEWGQNYTSSNGGTDWEALHEKIFYGDIYLVQFLDQNIAFAMAEAHLGGVAESVLYKSTDGGSNWSNCGNILNYEGAFHFVNENIGFMAVSEFGLTLYKTLNGGNDWTMIETGFDFDPINIKFFDPNLGLITGESQLIKTTDSGNSWEQIITNPTDWAYFHDIEFITYDEIFISGGGSAFYTFLLRSFDGGNTWEEDSLGYYGDAFDIYFFDEDIAYLACGSNMILKSTDGGNSWSETVVNCPTNIHFLAIHFPTAEIGFAVGYGSYETIIKTTDGGEIWNTINSGSTSGLNAVHFFDEQTGLVFGENGVVLKTETGGITGFEQEFFSTEEVELTVFPNPFRESITVNGHIPAGKNAITIELISLTGEKIAEREIRTAPSTIEIDGKNINPGIYLISIKLNNKILETQKIIKR